MVQTVKEYLIITLGMVILAIGLYLFLIPNDIAAGGAMGIAMLINHYVPFLQVGQLMLVINIILFIIAFVVLGTGFGLKTIYASLGLSGMIWLLETIYPLEKPLTDDLLLSALMGTIVSGAGMGIIFNQNASSGGTDIIAKILNRYAHIDIGKALLITDATITILAMNIFGFEKGTYALLAVIFNGYVIDYTIQGLNVAMQVFIMTRKSDAISRYVLDELGRGVTLFWGQGGYSGDELKVIKQVDPKAFITVSPAHEVLGEGFKTIGSE